MTIDDTLLTGDNHALLLIDHQYLQLLAVRSHPNDTIVNNAVMLARAPRSSACRPCSPRRLPNARP
jgi:hypothetical protein